MSQLPTTSSPTPLQRRDFLKLAASTTALLALSDSFAAAASHSGMQKAYTVQEIMDLILREGKLPVIADTVDTIKSGQASQQVTGIITTMFPTVPVMEEAVRLKANFIIAHEPSFYNHRDDSDWVENNEVLRKKKEFLDKHQLVIWRFHDYCHSLRPDPIRYALVKKMNWLPAYKEGENVMQVQPETLAALCQRLKSSLGIRQLRVIGDMEKTCSKIALLPGASGGKSHVSLVEKVQPDVLIVGEVSEWETAEYMRDSQSLSAGKPALIILGHAVSEEPGMELFADWLRPKLDGIRVTHVASQDPFTWI